MALNAAGGLHFDELSKLRVLDVEKHQSTQALREECKDFVDSTLFFVLVVVCLGLLFGVGVVVCLGLLFGWGCSSSVFLLFVSLSASLGLFALLLRDRKETERSLFT